MKQISIQDLKANLSAAVADAQSGETVLITRHNQPVAQLSPVRSPHAYRGNGIGARRLKPAVKQGTKGRYLTVLAEDRAGR